MPMAPPSPRPWLCGSCVGETSTQPSIAASSAAASSLASAVSVACSVSACSVACSVAACSVTTLSVATSVATATSVTSRRGRFVSASVADMGGALGPKQGEDCSESGNGNTISRQSGGGRAKASSAHQLTSGSNVRSLATMSSPMSSSSSPAAAAASACMSASRSDSSLKFELRSSLSTGLDASLAPGARRA
eukprot:scaffold19190_cov53-Phaeocystis_antarctica.AAC.2